MLLTQKNTKTSLLVYCYCFKQMHKGAPSNNVNELFIDQVKNGTDLYIMRQDLSWLTDGNGTDSSSCCGCAEMDR